MLRSLLPTPRTRPATYDASTSGPTRGATTYDANRNFAPGTHAERGACEHSFGLLNRLESQSYTHVGARELPSIDSITYAYTPNGSLQTVIETKSTSSGVRFEQTHRTFDALERMSSQTRDYGNTQKTTLFTYDTKGNRASVQDFTGASTVYTFDSVDRLKTAITPNGVATHVYFADGLLQRTEYRASAGAAVSTLEKRCYDNASRLTTVASGPGGFMADDCPATMGPVVFSRFDYALDANGNRVAQNERRASVTELTEYGYDELDRLVATVEPSEAKLYQLDAVGNRTGEKKTTPAAARLLGLTAAAFLALAPADTLGHVRGHFNRADWLTARRTLSANGLSELSRIDFAHDANGNTTSEHSATSLREYKWDSRNTLTAALIDGLDVGRYSYDWQLQRVLRTAGGSTVEYVLDDKLVLQELDGTHAATRRYHFGALSPLGVADSAGARWLLNDGLGSVSDEVTPSGALFKQRQYNAWGEYRNSTAPALTEPKLGYEGHQYDNETGLTYARARYLDNRYGVLLSRDAVEGNINDAPSLHRYTWARGGPLRFLDFTGLVEGESVEDQRARIMQMREAEARASRSGFAPVAPAEFDPERVEKDRWYRYLDADLSKTDRPMSALELRERQIAQGHARQAEYSLVYGKKVAEKVATEAVFLVGVETGLYFVGRAAPALLRSVVEAGRTEASLARVEAKLAQLEAIDAAASALPKPSLGLRTPQVGAESSLESYLAQEAEAKEAYERIRASETDVAEISKQTGYKAENIEKIKQHVFKQEHVLDRYADLGEPPVIGRFDPDLGVAQAWERLRTGSYTQADLQLMRHEAAEAWFMRKHGPSYKQAHEAAQSRYPSPKTEELLELLEPPKSK